MLVLFRVGWGSRDYCSSTVDLRVLFWAGLKWLYVRGIVPSKQEYGLCNGGNWSEMIVM